MKDGNKKKVQIKVKQHRQGWKSPYSYQTPYFLKSPLDLRTLAYHQITQFIILPSKVKLGEIYINIEDVCSVC